MTTQINNNWCAENWCQYAWCAPTRYDTLGVEVQITIPGVKTLGIQVTIAIYNITQMRILWELASDGDAGVDNFSASSQQSDDKSAQNLRSDIIEQYWQSTGDTSEWIQWAAGSGKTISLDTLGLWDTNLTSSAVLTLYGQGDGASSTPASWVGVDPYAVISMPEDPDEENVIWVSPTLPANQFKHWRLTIADPSNPDGYIRIGRVVAGSALIFVGENCLDEIDFQDFNFKDEFAINGFNGIANNRALRKRLTVRFRDLNSNGIVNYRKLRRYMRYARDTLKALVIVDPAQPYEYTVYSKLTSTPNVKHRYVDAETSYSTLELTYDEGR